jgi:hypothetical protein
MLPATCCSTPQRDAILAGRPGGGTSRPFPRPGGPAYPVGLVGVSCGIAVLVRVKEPGSVGEGWPSKNKIEAETEGGRGMSRLPMVRGESTGKLDGTIVSLISGSNASAPVIASKRSGICTTSDVTPTLYDPCTLRLEMDGWNRTEFHFRSEPACILSASTMATCLED